MRDPVALAFLALAGLGLASCSGSPASSGATSPSGAPPVRAELPGSPKAASEGEVTTPSGLKYVDLERGSGPEPKAGDCVAVHYAGWLSDGTKFDSSYDRGEPFLFTLKAQPFPEVIPGWDEGIATMRVGGKRRLVVPPGLAYGAAGVEGAIPPNATLVFDVQLLEIR